MSTSYYRLIEPFTSVRLECGQRHDRLTVFEMGANCGTLTLNAGTGKIVASLFALHQEDNMCPLRTHWGGASRGSIVTVNDDSMPDDATVLSEYGDVLTVAQVKARDGAGRDDGMPTELFGYQDKVKS